MLPLVKQIHQAQELGSQEHSGDVHCHWNCFLFLGLVSPSGKLQVEHQDQRSVSQDLYIISALDLLRL